MSTVCLSVAELMLVSGVHPDFEVEAPCAARAYRLAEADYVADHLLRRMLARGEAKMIIRLLILLFHEERAGQFKAYAQKFRIAIENSEEHDFGMRVVPRFVAIMPSIKSCSILGLNSPDGSTDWARADDGFVAHTRETASSKTRADSRTMAAAAHQRGLVSATASNSLR